MTTARSTPVDGFSLAYDDLGPDDPRPAGASNDATPAVVLLHGWPGDRADYRELVPLLAGRVRVIVPDLRGFGASDKHEAEPSEAYSAAAQARSVAALVEELGLGAVVLGGYDVGSRVAQTLARERPDLVRAMVLAPPMPGVGQRILDPGPQREFWYQTFHRLELSVALIDGNRDAVRAYLAHFWEHWSGPDFTLPDAELERLLEAYTPPGAFRASTDWYRAGAGSVAHSLAEQAPRPAERTAAPLTVLWPEHDPLFPREWSDRLDEFFADATLVPVDGAGHYAPLEYPDVMARHLLAAAGADS